VNAWFENAYTSMCMVDYPYPTSFLAPMPGWPVNFGCQAFTGLTVDSTDSEIFLAMAKAANVFYDYENATTCLNIYGDQEASNNSALDGEGWNILACSEMIMPMSSNGINDMFYP